MRISNSTGVRLIRESLHSTKRIHTLQNKVLRYQKQWNHNIYLFRPIVNRKSLSAIEVPQHQRTITRQWTPPKDTYSGLQWNGFCTRERIEKVQSHSKNNVGNIPSSIEQQTDSSDKLKCSSLERTGIIFPGLPVGLISGFLGSMAGIGGAVFAIPLLCRFGGYRQRIAAGSTLFAVFGTAASSAYAFHQAGQIDHFTALNLSLVGLVAAPIGALFSNSVSSGILRRSLGLFLMFISPLMFIRLFLQNASEVVAPVEDNVEDINSQSTLMSTRLVATNEDYSGVSVSEWNEVLYPWTHFSKKRFAFLSATGATVGFLSGFLGVSGGTLFTPVISFIGCSDGSRDFHTVLGTSFMAMTLPAVTGGIAYALKGSVRYSLVPSLCLGTVAGAAIGSRVALKLPDSFLKVGMAVVFSLVGYRIYKVPIATRRRN